MDTSKVNDRTILFCDYYKQWITVYKEGAIRPVTMNKYNMAHHWLEKLVPKLTISNLDRFAYQKLLNDYASEHERQTTMDFHHHLKCAILDAVDEGLIQRDPTHRHCVFTIDEELRLFFLEDRSLLDCLFNAVRSVLLRMFYQMNKSKNFVPGFICVLHTFGRPLEWNPHIHCLITEGGFSDDGFWRVVKHFNYTLLRKSFQTALLNEMEKHIGPSFKKTKTLIYKKDAHGFIPEPHYKMTRYYGLYARHRDNDKKLRKAIHPSKHKFILSYSKWRNNIAASFGYDPLCCSKCKTTMTLTDLYFNHKRVSLEEMYERSMAKIKCRSA